MRVDLSQVSQTRIKSGRVEETTSAQVPLPQNPGPQPADAQGDVDEKAMSIPVFGLGGTYSVASLKAAAEHQAKYFAVAENNIEAAQSTPRIPEALRRQFSQGM